MEPDHAHQVSRCLQRLLDLVKCSLCGKTIEDAHRLDVCNHVGCRSCMARRVEKEGVCPVCHVPVFKTNLVEHLHLKNPIQTLESLCDQFGVLLPPTNPTGTLPNCAASAGAQQAPTPPTAQSPAQKNSRKALAERLKSDPKDSVAELQNKFNRGTKRLREIDRELARRQGFKNDTAVECPVCISISAVGGSHAKLLEKRARGLGANFVFSSSPAALIPKLTHLIVNVDEKHRVKTRTVKYVAALMAGAWILDERWVTDSAAAGCWQPEAKYLARGSMVNENAPHFSRRTDPETKKLFSNVSVAFEGHFKKPFLRSEMGELLRFGGAEVFSSAEDLPKVTEAGEKRVVVVVEPKTESSIEDASVQVVSPVWIFDCISHMSCPPPS